MKKYIIFFTLCTFIYLYTLPKLGRIKSTKNIYSVLYLSIISLS